MASTQDFSSNPNLSARVSKALPVFPPPILTQQAARKVKSHF